ncbi:MAG TPA: hypothetical protein VER96_30700 [Polyangiaceae bacterium]|nr:hypothetical protein [Polyangiaceae bacterium]
MSRSRHPAFALSLVLVSSSFCQLGCGGHTRSKSNDGTPSLSGGTAGTINTDHAGTSTTSTTSTAGMTSSGGSNSAAQGGTSGTAATTSGNGGTEAVSSAAGSSGIGGTAAGGTAPVSCPSLPTTPIAASNIIQFNDNGAWNWFQDERVVVDQTANKFVIGSVASGGLRNGNIEAVIYDIATGSKQQFTLGVGDIDDRNAPAFVVRPDGKYAAAWAIRHQNCYSYSSVFDGATWSEAAKFDWTSLGCPWDGATGNQKIIYANPWYLAAENKIYSAVRSINVTPNFLVSSDGGQTYTYFGQLIAPPLTGIVSGYYKYWGNGSDRIDFVGTDAHPRDADNSLWHGYLKGGKLYDSKDKLVDDNAADKNAQQLDQFTTAVATGTTIGNVQLRHLWNHDLVRYPDGSISVLAQGRVDGSNADDPDMRLFYARFDGSTWKTTYLAKAGRKLLSEEQDFTGLGALHPDNPNIIFISTNVDPRDDTTALSRHEIFEGVTCDHGASWKWASLTQDSTLDNLRPVVPKWDASHTLLLWLKGRYNSGQNYSLAVVGTTTGL